MTHALTAHTLPAAPLLADLYGRRSSIDTTSLLIWLGLAVLIIGVVCAAAIVAHRAAKKFKHNSHQGLFFGLCKAHQLGRKERALLGQLARAHNTRFPGEVFINPNYLHPKKLPGSMKAKQQEVGRLYMRLFGEPQGQSQAKDGAKRAGKA